MNGYPARHFSLTNGTGPAVEDLPLLLRRLADEIVAAGISVESIMDVTFSNDELTDDGFYCWKATVYWSDLRPE